MKLAELDYDLPMELVAQEPVEPRDASRLLVLRRRLDGGQGELEDAVFCDLPGLLRRGDLLVRNNTRVLAARTWFRRPTGGRLEVLFLHVDSTAASGDESWEVLVRGRTRAGERLTSEASPADWVLEVESGYGDGRWLVRSHGPASVPSLLERHGATPLPPYIQRPLADGERYQTTYARRPGSAAAPTAGLHFTPGLDAALRRVGVDIVEVTLHVGLGTFKPLDADLSPQTRLHAEEYELPLEAWRTVTATRAAGRRVIAVGTTTVRLLEQLALTSPRLSGEGSLRGSTELCIAPGFHFRLVDGLITNFHLPRTSLLALVMAFCGVEETRALYAHAVAHAYRFYSFGDAMLAL